MDFYVFEHVRMPINHLFANAVNDIIDIKMSLFFFYCRVKNHLKQARAARGLSQAQLAQMLGGGE